jgi:CheY-like chemotaxis protein
MIPLKTKKEARKTPAPVENPTSGVRQLVLVVEDHDDTRFLLRLWMEMRGCRVVEARNGEEAVRLAEALGPDLVLMDTNLPLLDGLMATRRIRNMKTICNVPIVFLSGHAQPDLRLAALASGGNEYLVKPFDPKELDSALERHLGKAPPRSSGDLQI